MLVKALLDVLGRADVAATIWIYEKYRRARWFSNQNHFFVVYLIRSIFIVKDGHGGGKRR